MADPDSVSPMSAPPPTETYEVEDLGVQLRENVFNLGRLAVDPATGREVAVVCHFVGGGFTVIDLAARSARPIRPGKEASCCRNICVGFDGAVYQATGSTLCRWDWQGDETQVVAEIPDHFGFTVGVDPEGRVYLPNYVRNTMFRYCPQADAVESLGDYSAFGLHIRDVGCAADGWVYVTCTDHHETVIVGIDPDSGEKSVVANEAEPGKSFPLLLVDGRRRVIAPYKRWGRPFHCALIGGRAVPIAEEDVLMASDGIENHKVAFSDGSYITEVAGETVRFLDANGRVDSFEFEKEGDPLVCFSVAAGAGKIWCGTILPLRLFSHDEASGAVEDYGSPVRGGEIYSMVVSGSKLFMASYGHAVVSRLDLSKPVRIDTTVNANPGRLGQIKEGDRADEQLHRPRGRDMASDGTVFFAAMGGYGCDDSGVCRVDPETEELTRRILPNADCDALVYLPESDQLLVSEARKTGEGIRFTFLCARTCEILRSEVVIEDEGGVISWLYGGEGTVYGLHNHRGTLFEYDLESHRIVRALPELGLGDHCYNTLMFGPDGRIWGLTNQCVYAADRELASAEAVAPYESVTGFYRFGMVTGSDGNIYFPNGTRLMRVLVP